ncbi:hypothetical protein LXL04_000722 [Taraxacum kok-saghyz]
MKQDEARQSSQAHPDNSSSPTVLVTDGTQNNNSFRGGGGGGYCGGRGGRNHHGGRGGGRSGGRHNYSANGGNSGNYHQGGGNHNFNGSNQRSGGGWVFGWYQVPPDVAPSQQPGLLSTPTNGHQQVGNQQQHQFFRPPTSSPVPPQQAFQVSQPTFMNQWPTNASSESTAIPQMFNTMTLNDPGQGGWFMDTGATAHLHSDAGILKSVLDNNSISSSSVLVGDGSSIPVTKVGNTTLPNPYRTFTLKNVLITPRIIKNLISVRSFTRQNMCIIEFDPFGFSVKDLRTKQTLMRCDSTGDLYPVTAPAPQAFASVAQSLWHQRLGHPGHHVFKHLVDNHIISCSLNKNSSLCHACQLGKHVKLPFSVSNSISHVPFEIVHSDVWTSPFHQLFDQNGIQMRFSCPYTSQQNGKSERMLRIINNTIRTLLFHARMPPTYWVEALHMATYLLNILPTTTLNNDTPYYKLFQKQPSYAHLRVFGCLGFPQIVTPHKLSPRSTPCVFLGYPSNHIGYRCLNLDTQDIIISRHVVFDETDFPFGSMTYNFARLLSLEKISNSASIFPYSAPQNGTNLDYEFWLLIRNSPVGSLPHETSPPSPPSIFDATPNIIPPVSLSQPPSTPLTPSTLAFQSPRTTVSEPASSAAASPASTTSTSDPPISDPTRSQHPMLFKKKLNADGSLSRYKARLVANGRSQRPALEPDAAATYGLLISTAPSSPDKLIASTLDMFAAMKKHNQFEAATFQTVQDIKMFEVTGAAQSNSKSSDSSEKKKNGRTRGRRRMAEPEICNEIEPEIRTRGKSNQKSEIGNGDAKIGLEITRTQQLDGDAMKLRSMYGLKQAPRAWFQRHDDHIAYLLLYEDDIILTGSSPQLLTRITDILSSEFSMTDLSDLHYFLGVSATRSKSGMFLSQEKYATEILDRASMTNYKPARTPADLSAKFDSSGPPVADPTLYRSLAGALQYLTFTRPDISYAVQQVCLYMHDPREPHFAPLKRILRYIRGTTGLGLQIYSSPSRDIIAYSDADWAGCPVTRRSISGYCVFLGHNLLSWSAKRQNTVSRSSTEAEYRGVSNAVAETCWIRNLLLELH